MGLPQRCGLERLARLGDTTWQGNLAPVPTQRI